ALHYPVLSLGADVVVEAATKYICGHSDISLGIAAASDAHGKALRQAKTYLGVCAGPDDLYTGLRGLRTMRLRLEESAKNGLYLAEKLAEHPLVTEVLHPGLPTSCDYEIYKRDFSGPCGLFAFVIRKEMTQEQLDKAIEQMEIFAIGDSWGGYESLIKQAHYEITKRSFAPTHADGYLVRIYAGLEHAEDLWADIATMLEAISAS
ncbi:MAG: PLP-dependent transferase, partial [Candidatus Puniceispirillaceae bacterium]